ncbi:MAG: hypothetical protein Q7J73_11230 [Dehalococcoidales bacterium]|nr:hypothetical protein [Dehalococcoidales bacterium]
MLSKHVRDPEFVKRLGEHVREYPKSRKIRKFLKVSSVVAFGASLVVLFSAIGRGDMNMIVGSITQSVLWVTLFMNHMNNGYAEDELHDFEQAEYEYLIAEGEEDAEVEMDHLVAEVEAADAVSEQTR